MKKSTTSPFRRGGEVLNPHPASPKGRSKNIPPSGGTRGDWEGFKIQKPQHKYILSLLRQIGWETTSERYGIVADMPRFAKWLQSEKSPVRKPLNDQSKAETTKIINALESMLGKKFSKQ